MDQYKNINIVFFVLALAMAIGVRTYWATMCGGHSCSLYLIDWFFLPILWGATAWSIIFGTLLFFPGLLFKRWLINVGIWGMLLMIFVVLDTDPRASSFWLDIDRGRAAWISGVFVGFITAVYILGMYGYSWMKTKTLPASLTRLSILLIGFALFYFFSVV